MRIIQSLNNINQLKKHSLLAKDFLEQIHEDFQWRLNEFTSLDCEFTPEDNGITVILEPGDTSEALKYIGISSLKEAIPEFVDTFDIGGSTYTKSLILFNNEYSVMLYGNPSEIDKEFDNWINENL
ncbi:hypothetical protein [Haloplasma contractile]|uniref:Uncharacterized protein n=1 Tax=Haloplasma contractile SSD-17B TaxID=1033810 RepID=U2DR42_9MOLU|nr:hypothetical protein [Haloplasma contractile]ERJ11032.1 hypothetical protein HLPCO_002923 [Haloplasma contractile SSD-17B]